MGVVLKPRPIDDHDNETLTMPMPITKVQVQ